MRSLPPAGDSHPVLSQLRPALKKLPDLERGVTRAYHRTSRPSDFAALLQQFARLPQALGVGADLRAGAGGVATQAAAAAPGAAGSGSDGAGEGGEAGGEAAGAASQRPPLNLQGVESALLRQLLGAAADPSVAAAAQEMLGSLDLEAAEKNDKLHVLK